MANPFNMRVYQFQDGIFSFWTAHFGSWANDARIVFRVRLDTSAQKRIKEKELSGFDRLLPSQPSEVDAWVAGHPDYTLRNEMVLITFDGMDYLKARNVSYQTAGEWTP